MVYRYFNDNNESIPVLAARVLGHARMSSCVLTYLGGVQLADMASPSSHTKDDVIIRKRNRSNSV